MASKLFPSCKSEQDSFRWPYFLQWKQTKCKLSYSTFQIFRFIRNLEHIGLLRSISSLILANFAPVLEAVLSSFRIVRPSLWPIRVRINWS
jgi:hypothetical protein